MMAWLGTKILWICDGKGFLPYGYLSYDVLSESVGRLSLLDYRAWMMGGAYRSVCIATVYRIRSKPALDLYRLLFPHLVALRSQEYSYFINL